MAYVITAWLVSAWLGVGIFVADDCADWPSPVDNIRYRKALGFAVFFGLFFGPVFALFELFATGFAAYGLRWLPPVPVTEKPKPDAGFRLLSRLRRGRHLWVLVLLPLLAGCKPNVFYAPYCDTRDGADDRAFVLACTKANQITSIQGRSPEDVISTCADVARQTCPRRWLVGDSRDDNPTFYDIVPCDETRNPEYVKACRNAGWVPRAEPTPSEVAAPSRRSMP